MDPPKKNGLDPPLKNRAGFLNSGSKSLKGGSKATFFGGSDVSFGHHRCC